MKGQGMNAPVTPTGTAKEQARAKDREVQRERVGDGHIMGNLTQDPELRYTPSGRAVTNLRIAFTPRVQNDDGKGWHDGPTEFYDIQVWGQQGERAAEHLQRGDRIVAAGTWTREKFVNRKGEDAEVVRLTAQDVGPSLLFKGATVHRNGQGQEV
jgi:single-strand DNA-binding protein